MILFLFFQMNCHLACSQTSISGVHNGVNIYFNTDGSGGTNIKDGYYCGKKWQCVEFVRRYYFERFEHKMPSQYGHAKDYFNGQINSGELNPDRGLIQYSNTGTMAPKCEDIVVFGPNEENAFGHVAIVCQINNDSIELVQQNTSNSRTTLPLSHFQGIYTIADRTVRGWLRIAP